MLAEASRDEDEVVVVIAEEAELYKKPSRKSKSVDFAEEGDKLFVVEREGDWRYAPYLARARDSVLTGFEALPAPLRRSLGALRRAVESARA